VGSADPRIEERVGSTLNDKWTLEKLLGQGGMAAVYAARHRNGARAAVKMLHPELTRHPNVRERFLREGYAANKVEHRGVVQVLDDDIVKEGPDDGAAYLVMELLDGESLQQRMERTPPPSDRELLEVMAGVLDVLEMAHQRGVIHRDLKPDNLFLARDPNSGTLRLKVLDFGLARIAEAESVTVDGLALGTPHFMSPEQAAGRKDDIDGRTDIFSLGATFFTIMAGRHVHEGENTIQVVVKMATEPAPPVRSVAPTMSEPIAHIIDKSLSFERESRYQSAAEMRGDVDLALRALDIGHSPTIELYATSRKTMSAGKIAAELQKDSELKEAGWFEEAPPRSPPPPPPPPKDPTIALSSGDIEEADASKEERPPSSRPPRSRRRDRGGGFPVFKIAVLVAAAGAAWVYWPEIRARFDHLDANTLPSAIVDAGNAVVVDIVDAATTTTIAITGADDASAASEDAAVDPADAGDAGDAGEDELDDDAPDAAPTATDHDASSPVAHVTPPRPKPAHKKPPKRPPQKPPRKK
jgi:serine/threonine-protein kinase